MTRADFYPTAQRRGRREVQKSSCCLFTLRGLPGPRFRAALQLTWRGRRSALRPHDNSQLKKNSPALSALPRAERVMVLAPIGLGIVHTPSRSFDDVLRQQST